MANPFRKILQLSAGDFVAKALSFLAFVYLARTLDVTGYGVLEFANAILAYFLLLADGGLEGWGVREVARTGNVRDVAGRVTVLRLLLATAAFVLLLAMLPVLPGEGPLRLLLVILGLGLFAQGATLKWVFMGEQKMASVATGLMIAQLAFAGSVFAFVRGPSALLWVAVFKLAADLMLAAYFAWRFVRDHGPLRLTVRRDDGRTILRPALTIGAATALSMINYNFDSAMLGFMTGAAAVGWYSAAYKPVTVALAMPLTYFMGLFPVLADAYARDAHEFRRTVNHSLRLSASLAIPIGVGGALLAGPIILLLFGPAYAPAIPVLRVLVWSAVLVILRGTYRHGITVSGHFGVDLRCAMASAGLNIAFNVLLIPRYGMIGAAFATLAAELIWLLLLVNRLRHYVLDASPLRFLWKPVLAGLAMAGVIYITEPVFWIARAAAGCVAYLAVLLALIGSERHEWLAMVRHPRPSP